MTKPASTPKQMMTRRRQLTDGIIAILEEARRKYSPQAQATIYGFEFAKRAQAHVDEINEMIQLAKELYGGPLL